MEKMGIYVHIPFCVQKCHYCAFHSFKGSDTQIETYFKALWDEIKLWENKKTPEVRTVYFGGGTPSYVPALFIEETLKRLGETFGFDSHDQTIEKTIEVNPASAMDEKLKVYADAGFNRISIGLQTGQDRLLKRIGRAHTVDEFKRTIESCANYFNNISADVMFGLPNQTMDDLKETLELILSSPGIKHVSCYALGVEEGTPFEKQLAEGKLELPDEETERQMQYYITNRLSESEIDQYEISNYAKQGYESKHNSSYWKLTPYIGLGLGASSYYNERRYTHTSDFDKYISSVEQGCVDNEEDYKLSVVDKKGEFMFLGLRRNEGVSDKDYMALFGVSFYDDFGEEITKMCEQGLLVKDGEKLALTGKGMDFANQVFMAFV